MTDRIVEKGSTGKLSPEEERNVLCAANSYISKFYINQRFGNLPDDVKKQLQIIAVEFTEDVGGIFIMRYGADGRLLLQSVSDATDYLYDDIGADLKIREIAKKYEKLFEKLELYYRGMQVIEAGGNGQ